jgi:integrase
MKIRDLIDRHAAFASEYYRKPSGRPTGHAVNLELACRELVALFGDLDADEIRGTHVRQVREAMIAADLCRNEINKRVGWLRGIWRWGVEEDFVDVATLERLRAVRPLEAGRSKARESAPVPPVPLDVVWRTVDALPPDAAAQVRILAATGMRPGEVRIMQSGRIDTSGEVWTYRPAEHKTQHKGKFRAIPLLGDALAVLQDRLSFYPEVYLFSPDGGDSPYEKNSLRQTIRRACKRLGVQHWSPNQLRHSVATALRQAAGDEGLEMARAYAGHASVDTTLIYAEFDERKAVKAAELAQRLTARPGQPAGA